jgi:hypothetical protein
VRARIFRYRSPDSYTFERQLDVVEADEAWRRLQSLGEGAALREGDIVYVGDLYFELDGDGGWRSLPPGQLTVRLYESAGVALGVAAFELSARNDGTTLQFSFRAVRAVAGELSSSSREAGLIWSVRLKTLVKTGSRLGIDPDPPNKEASL